MTTRLTHAQQEHMRKEYRRQEDIRDDHLAKLKADSLIQTFQQSDERIDAKRFLRKLAAEENEREIQQGILISAENKRQREAQLHAEKKLAEELENLRLEQVRDNKMRQQIRENSYELRELEEKLRAAYMNKERAAQIAERKAEILELEESEIKLNAQMQQELQKSQQHDKEQQKLRDQAAVVYQQELEKQLLEQEHKKQMEYEEFLKNKLMIDDMVRKINEEDGQEKLRRLEKQRATRAYIAEFKAKRELWKKEEQQRQDEENEKLLKFAAMQTNRENARMAQVREREEKLSTLQHKLGQKIRTEREQRNEMERLRQELYLEEQEETARVLERAEIEKKFKRRIELRKAHAEQISYKQAKKTAELEEEEVFRQQMLAKFAHDDRIELMNAAARRQKQLEHRKAVESLIEERQNQFAAERQQEINEFMDAQNREEIRQQIIEEERQRLLKEHATKLAGYMPKGVFRNLDEVAELGDQTLRGIYAENTNDLTDLWADKKQN